MLAKVASASDMFVLQFSGIGGTGANCRSVVWKTGTLLANTNTAPATITLLGASENATEEDAPTTATLGPGEVTSLAKIAPLWAPPNPSTYALWVVHLDIPDGVLLENGASVGDGQPCLQPQPIFSSTTHIPTPSILVPANMIQTRLGTGLGDTLSHQNVTIYNGGANTAAATVNLIRTCDQRVVSTRTVSIAPNAVLQVFGLKDVDSTCTGVLTQVIVSEPSLVWVSTIAEPDINRRFRTSPIVEYSVK